MSSATSWLDALAQHAADNGFGTLGTDIWVGRRSDDPSLPDPAIVLTEVPGQVMENMGLGGDVWMPMFAIYVRGGAEDYATARKRIHDLFWLYSAVLERTIHGFRFLRISNPGATPGFLGRDASERPAFTVELWTWQPQPTPPTVTYVAS